MSGINVTSNGLICNLLSIRILNRQCNALVDTGAGRSIMSKQWCDTLHLQIEPLENDDPTVLVNADQGRMKVWGVVLAPVLINGIAVVHKFLVIENLITKVLLGCDFLVKTEAKIDLKHKVISFFDDTVFAQLTTRSENFQIAFISSTLNLNPKTEYLIKLKLIRPFKSGDTVLLESCEQMIERGIAVAAVITKPRGKNIICRVFNTFFLCFTS